MKLSILTFVPSHKLCSVVIQVRDVCKLRCMLTDDLGMPVKSTIFEGLHGIACSVCLQAKGPVTQASITRTKTRTLKMHPLDWLLNKPGRILRGAIQPIECVIFALLSLLLPLQCDSALTVTIQHLLQQLEQRLYRVHAICVTIKCIISSTGRV